MPICTSCASTSGAARRSVARSSSVKLVERFMTGAVAGKARRWQPRGHCCRPPARLVETAKETAMAFARAIWRLLVGIKDALVLILLLMFFGLLFAGLRSKPRQIGEGVLLVDLNGSLVEQPARASTAELIGGASRAREYGVGELTAALDRAATDDRVKAVALDLDGFLGGGQTGIATVGGALDKVRRAGKP